MNYIKIFNTLVFLLFLVLGAYLLYSFIGSEDWEEVKHIIATGDFSVAWLMLFFSVSVYIIRTLRWNLLLRAAGQQPDFMYTFSATSFAYGISFFVPRLGEVFRCTFQKEQKDIPVAVSLGTVLLERVVDILMLLLLIISTVLFQYEKVYHFFYDTIWKKGFAHRFETIQKNAVWMAVIGFFLILGLYIIYRKLKKHPLLQNFISGWRSILALQHKLQFVVYTFSIWFCYYILSYGWFKMFDATSSLGVMAGLTICTVGTIGRSIPISGGGMGAYHYLVGAALVLYGVPSIHGKALATVIHGGQTAFTFLMCFVGGVFLLYRKLQRNTYSNKLNI